MNGKEKEQKKQTDRTALLRSAAVVLVVLALIIGLTYAWFFNQANIATLVTVSPPSEISIRGAHGQELTELDLSYTDDDVTTDDEGNRSVTIHRVISVKNTGEDHKLEIVHTTNMKGLTFTLYPATEVQSGGELEDGGYSYTYNAGNAVPGGYINININRDSSSNDYKYADISQHQTNYGNYSSVQSHAEPLYWLVDKAQKATGADENGEKTDCLTYYVLEISWTETGKETDMFYVLAQNA